MRLSHAIYNVRVLLKERAGEVAERGNLYTTDAEILAFIKMWLHQRFVTNTSEFTDVAGSTDGTIEQKISALSIPSGRGDPDPQATFADDTYPEIPLRESASWALVSGVYEMLNARNDTISRPGDALLALLQATRDKY